LIATRESLVAYSRKMSLNWGCTVSLDFFVTLLFLFLARKMFPAADFLQFFLWPQCAHVTLFVKCDKFELAFWLLCSMHDVIQLSPYRVVCRSNCFCRPFTACTWCDSAVCFNKQVICILASSFSRSPAKPTLWGLLIASCFFQLADWLSA